MAATQKELWAARQKLELTPEEIAGAFKSYVTPRAKLALLIFPEIGAHNETRVQVAELQWMFDEMVHESLTPYGLSYPDWLYLRTPSEAVLEEQRTKQVTRICRDVVGVRVRAANAIHLVDALKQWWVSEGIEQAIPRAVRI
jgi:hypothetical protein